MPLSQGHHVECRIYPRTTVAMYMYPHRGGRGRFPSMRTQHSKPATPLAAHSTFTSLNSSQGNPLLIKIARPNSSQNFMNSAKTMDLIRLCIQINNSVVFFPIIHISNQNKKHVNSKLKVPIHTMFSDNGDALRVNSISRHPICVS